MMIGDQKLSRDELRSKLGFRFGTNGPHAARTMMLEDLRILFAALPAGATKAEYADEVLNGNVLGKPTKKARELAFRHMTALYGLDPSIAVFRALRRLWPIDAAGQPLLALSVALARDPLLRATQTFILGKVPGVVVPREELEQLLSNTHRDRFSAASLKSFAQNVNGTWTAAGFLSGKARKTRALPVVTPTNIAMCLFLGYLEGASGQRLFSSPWMAILPASPGELETLVNSASHRGLLVFLNAGGVKEVRFPDYLTAEEELVRQEVSYVV